MPPLGPGVSRSILTADAAVLLPLLDQKPSLLIYTRSSSRFAALRQVYNTAITTQPLALVRPRSEDEVIAIVRFCSCHNVPLAVRTGGHDQWGRSLVADGVVLDMRSFDKIDIPAHRMSARIGGGVLGGQLQGYLDTPNLCTPTGFCGTVGYVGWAAGGGYGVLQGAYGMGADQILGARLVTPDGRVVDTDVDHELLWAVRGAGTGNFGVVVEVRLKVYLRPRVLGGFLAFPLAELSQVFAGFEGMCRTNFPDAFSGDFLIVRMPHVGPVLMTMFSWAAKNDAEFKAGEEYLKMFSKLGTVLVNTVNETTPSGFTAALDATNSTPQPYHYLSRNVTNLSPELAAILTAHPPPLDFCTIVIHNAHGAAIKPNPESCFANRVPHIVLGVGGGLKPGISPSNPDKQTVVQWADGVGAAITDAGLAHDMGYMNFTPPEECDTDKFYGVKAAEALRALKKKYDGGNLFALAYPSLA
ncbi:putative oxidoreductase [Coniochaeta sp. 2T2.1]|nr:putative oxidoreductase [Coniochaeta sp. 2T2.1]